MMYSERKTETSGGEKGQYMDGCVSSHCVLYRFFHSNSTDELLEAGLEIKPPAKKRVTFLGGSEILEGFQPYVILNGRWSFHLSIY